MTLGFLVFLFLGFCLGGYVLWRRERDPEPHRKLLMELEDEEAAGSEGKDKDATDEPQTEPRPRREGKPPAKSWERDGDWWKKEP